MHTLIAAPIELDGRRRILFVRLRQETSKGADVRFYVHEAVLEDDAKTPSSFKSAAAPQSGVGRNGGTGRMTSLYQKALEFNPSTVSKVVDENGEPMVMYTGTSVDKDFAKFKMPRNGVWFTKWADSASDYAMENDSKGLKYNQDTGKYADVNNAPRIIPVFLNVRNQYKMTSADMRRVNVSNYKSAQSKLFDELKSSHDGIQWSPPEWVVIGSPTQIKSATGNVGAYGQRPITATEAGNMGMTEGDANDAQGKGDMTPMQARLHQNHRVGDSVLGLDIRPADIIQLWSIDTKPAQKGELSISFLLNNARTPTPHLRQGYDADVGWIWRSQTAIHGHVKSTQDD